MEDIFKKRICSICRNIGNCNSFNLEYKQENDVKIISCKNYLKDESKIVPFKEPEFIEIKGRKLYEI